MYFHGAVQRDVSSYSGDILAKKSVDAESALNCTAVAKKGPCKVLRYPLDCSYQMMAPLLPVGKVASQLWPPCVPLWSCTCDPCRHRPADRPQRLSLSPFSHLTGQLQNCSDRTAAWLYLLGSNLSSYHRCLYISYSFMKAIFCQIAHLMRNKWR